jgi:glycosyltransferase involved in cell wall biosynthesis
MSQSAPCFEIIVVNDGSTDQTPKIIERLNKEDQFRIITTPNQGLGPARNVGLENARGEYIFFFDSDDILSEQFVKTISSVAEAAGYPDILAFSGAAFLDNSVERRLPVYARRQCRSYNNGCEAFVGLMKSRSFYPNAYLYVSKRKLWMEHGLRFMPIIHEDEELILRLFAQAKATAVIDDVLLYRRLRDNSIMTSGASVARAEGLLYAILSTTHIRDELQMDSADFLWALRHRLDDLSTMYIGMCEDVGRKAKYHDLALAYRAYRIFPGIRFWWKTVLPSPLRQKLKRIRSSVFPQYEV